MRNDLMAAVDGLVSLQSYIETDYQEKHGEDYENVLGYAEDMNAFDTALTALREKQQRQPDPDTGLVPCGCGGKAKIWLSDFTRFTYLITDYEVGCTECAMTTGWVRGKQENAMNVWNTAMGWKGSAE